MLAYLHPFLAVLVLALLAHVASLGVRARNDRRDRALHLRRHAQFGRWMYAGIVITWATGLLSMWMLRPPAELATSFHFRVGIALVAVLTASAVSSRWMHVERVRAIHPWIGVLAMLVAAAQIVFGLQILP
ncbi:MAG: DUF4079 family protein [Candidatus Binatia bacterium]